VRLRLRYDQPTWILAKDSKTGRVLRGGLGVLGVGMMWQDADAEEQATEEYLRAPEEPDPGDPPLFPIPTRRLRDHR
jgi:hypothetical protein